MLGDLPRWIAANQPSAARQTENELAANAAFAVAQRVLLENEVAPADE